MRKAHIFSNSQRRRALLEAIEPRRLMAAAPLDAGFGEVDPAGDGVARTGAVHYTDSYDSVGTANVVELSTGKLITIGDYSSTNGELALHAFNADGSVDENFGVGGETLLSLGFGGNETVATTALAAGPNGTFYVAGFYSDPTLGEEIGYVARASADGTMDASFGTGNIPGVVFFGPGDRDVQGPHIAVAADGSVYAGYSLAASAAKVDLEIIKLRPDGTPDITFSGDGLVQVPLTGWAGSLDAVLLDGSSLVLVGNSFANYVDNSTLDPSVFLAKLNANGSLNGAFDTSDGVIDGFGLTKVAATGSFDVQGAALARTGPAVAGVVVGGNLTEADGSGVSARVLKFGATFASDTGFGTDGIATLGTARAITLAARDETNSAVSVDTAGDIYLVGDEALNPSLGLYDLAVVRLNSNGTRDIEFDGDGIFTLSDGEYDTATAITTTASGAQLVSGIQENSTFGLGSILLKFPAAPTGPTDPVDPEEPEEPPVIVNTAPVVSPVTSSRSTAGRGQEITFSASFVDADAADTFEVSWNFGDGVVTPFVSTTSKNVSKPHAFLNAGTYTITLSVKDSGGHTSTNTGTVTIGNYTLVNGRLGVTGTTAADTIVVDRDLTGAIILRDNTSVYPISDTVSSIVIDGGAGADLIRVHAQLDIPATLIGGAGNDTLRGGAGDDVLLAGDGNDTVIGRAGRDLIGGGIGSDLLVGSEEDDILISGTTSYADTNFAAYSSIMAEWTSSHSWLTRVANLSGIIGLPSRLNGNTYLTPGVNVFNDTSIDTVSGGAGADFYFVSYLGPTADRVSENYTGFSPTVALLATGN